MLEAIFAVLVYPGLVLTHVLGLIFGWLSERQAPRLRLRIPRLNADNLAGVASILLAALALALLPWPLQPATGGLWIGGPLALWIAVEGAFLVPLLPGLLAPSPLAARAAVREAQIGAAGRFVLWLAVGTALWSGAGWAVGELPGQALAALAGPCWRCPPRSASASSAQPHRG